MLTKLLPAVIGLALAAPPAPLAAQPDERIVYTTYIYGRRSATSEIFTILPDGTGRQRLTRDKSFDFDPAWSPDRSRIAYVHHILEPRNPDVWVMDADGSHKRRLTRGPRDDEFPQWSPDGARIAWLRTRGDTPWGEIHVMAADGSGKRLLVRSAAWPQWSPDGERIAFMKKTRCESCVADWELGVVDVSTGEVDRLTANEADELAPVWSPDGATLAFTRNRDDGGDLFTISADGEHEEQLTAVEGHAYGPAWSPDGSEVAFSLVVDFEDYDTRLSVVDVETREVRHLTDAETGGVAPEWSSDGSRIAFLGFFDGNWELAIVGPDGTGMGQITDSGGEEGRFDW